MSRSRPPSGPSLGIRSAMAGAVALALILMAAAPAAAAESAPVPPPPTIPQEAARANQAAGRWPEAEAVRRLARSLEVPAQQVADLRDQKLAFGDVAIALAIARVARKPLNAVLALWANERLDWTEVAARMGAPSAQVVRHLRLVRRALDASPAR